MDCNDWVKEVIKDFQAISDASIAKGQAAYMRNQFTFFGVKTPNRQIIQKKFFDKSLLPQKKEAFQIIEILWGKKERELHYFAQELMFKYRKSMQQQDILFFEWMAKHNAWWDTIDFIAPKLMGEYFKQFPEERLKWINKWVASDNFWLQRCAILFQLKHKQETDLDLLADIIQKLSNSEEFFIRKAIGWVLREYAKTDPFWVRAFVENHELSNLSRREAMKYLGA